MLKGLVLAGCAPSYKPEVYLEGQAQQAMRIRFVTVIDVRPTGIAGAVVGGVVGHAVEQSANTRKGVEITYRLDDTGETQVLVQEQDDKNPIMKGDRIRILQGKSGTRAERA